MAFAAHWEDASAEQRRDDARRTLLIETGAALNVGEEIDIELPHVGTTPATTRWQSGRLFGCEFIAPLPAAALSAAQLRSVPAGAAPAPANGLPDAGFPQRLQRLR